MNRNSLWTSDDACAATGGTTTQSWAATGVAIDSRGVAGGDLFVALAGPKQDGHDYVAAALARGAAAAIVHRVPPGVAADAPLLLVADTLEALVALGRATRARTTARIVAVTGSVGKTGVKEALRIVLGDQGAVAASVRSFNNQWGVPLSLARMGADARFGVFEVGMNHAGEIAPLSRLLRPDVALITTVEAVHLGHFPSIGAIADAKAEVFDGMSAAGVAVLNHDNPFYHHLSQAARARGVRTIVSFGAHPDSTVRLVQAEIGAETSRVKAAVGRRSLDASLNVPGRHWVANSLAVLAVVHALGADLGRAAASLAKVEALAGRGQRHRVYLGCGAMTVIDESYNSSPVTLKAALQVLAAAVPGTQGRRIAVLGDMLELGDDAPGLHAGFASCAKAKNIDLVFTVGGLMAHLRDALPEAMRGGHAADAEAILPALLEEVRAGDVVLVKGSRGIALERVAAALIDMTPQPARCAG
ncbi:MAG: UDP-N-acetylmuramoylalanyl-D-glutamyl-2,6-diaminopimelate--D-alanyl-D-alanine ligase [Alphaproteobacteria bacterium]|nr:UDP-N-acetylmuramoylalanyl-D-glutamyl-2,6-diaminopimelate--D-alanyl-D-alanine ligase [Alphaproteobacteria bacterium]